MSAIREHSDSTKANEGKKSYVFDLTNLRVRLRSGKRSYRNISTIKRMIFTKENIQELGYW